MLFNDIYTNDTISNNFQLNYLKKKIYSTMYYMISDVIQ